MVEVADELDGRAPACRELAGEFVGHGAIAEHDATLGWGEVASEEAGDRTGGGEAEEERDDEGEQAGGSSAR